MDTPNILIMNERGDHWKIEDHPETHEFSGYHSEMNINEFPKTPASKLDEFLSNRLESYSSYSEKWHPIIRKWIELNPFIK